ncbi:L-seryl-tRNA(Sec) selenium transferase [Candidatus Acetothermia bacterium]|nr:L-seryl-tRNA(Sec) selenium transferase [Candidatus Acetothermia bacterium]
MSTKDRLRRVIPAVDKLLNHCLIRSLIETGVARETVLRLIRSTLEQLRRLSDDELTRLDLSLDHLAQLVVTHLEAQSLQRVINGTGIILHTGLGRAPLSLNAIETIEELSGYCSLEIDIQSGRRGSRDLHVAELLVALTGAEAGLVVNNNAAALLLILNTFAQNREVIVSRGQLVEIGGSFRLPDVMRASGAKLIEVGTTNRTYCRDYEEAIGPETAILLKVHTSNFKQIGFVAEVPLLEMVTLAAAHELLVIDDIGSGALFDLTKYDLGSEPTAQASIATGADLVTFSADKLVGGPQGGIIVGKCDLIAQLKENPLMRALRIDKLRLAALQATLRSYLSGKLTELPVWKMALRPLSEIKRAAETLAAAIEIRLKNEANVTMQDGTSQLGGGSLPGEEIPTLLVAIEFFHLDVEKVAEQLRMGDPAIFTRISNGKLLIDLRTLHPEDHGIIIERFGNLSNR